MIVSALYVALSLANADLPIDPPIMESAIPLEEPGRYRSLRSFDKTLEYYKRLFRNTGSVQWRTIVNLPSVKARHIKSLKQKTRWEGLNIYEKNGETRLYFLMRRTDSGSATK
jgi:hypothetical protein